MVKKFGGGLLLILLCIGVFRGVVHYQEEGGRGFQNLGTAIVMAAEDVTYKWIGALLDMATEGARTAPDLIPAP